MTCAGMVSLTPSSPPFAQCVCLKAISLAYNHHIINIIITFNQRCRRYHAASLGSVLVCVCVCRGREEDLSSSVLPHFMCHHCSGCTVPACSEFRWTGAVATDTQSDTCHVPALHCWPHRWSALTVCWGHTSSVHCTS